MNSKKIYIRPSVLILLIGVIIIALVLLIGIPLYSGEFQLARVRLNTNAWLSELYTCSGPVIDGELSEPKEVFQESEWQDIYICGNIQSKEPISLDSQWFFKDEESLVAWNLEIEVFDPGDFYISLYDTYNNTLQRDEVFPKLGEYVVIVEQGRMEMGKVYFEIIDD